MNYNEAAKMLVEKGFYDTKIKAFDAEPIRAALAEFMNRPLAERLLFLQKQIDSVLAQSIALIRLATPNPNGHSLAASRHDFSSSGP
ncbi:MAG: hypothetical protein NWR30_08770 [Salibacteraceae bacterium]|nr:hypothetical protein [Salibacteraceae bacterium]